MKIVVTGFIAIALSATGVYAQSGVAFTPSPAHSDPALLTGYKVRIYSSSSITLRERDLGKPAPNANNEIVYLDATLFSNLEAGSYIAAAFAYGPGGASTEVRVPFSVAMSTSPPPPTGIEIIPESGSTLEEVILHAAEGTLSGRWQALPDNTAAGGVTAYNPDGEPTRLTISDDYVELTFAARAGVPYHVWLRGRADSDMWTNDSVFVQFSNAQDATGQSVARIGTENTQKFVLQEGTGAAMSGWGWFDASFGGLAAHVYFAEGTQRIRIYQREDGISIDQIVISAGQYLTTRPGAVTSDLTALSK